MDSIIKLTPHCEAYIWGGTRLKKFYKDFKGDVFAEAWVLSTHDNGQSISQNDGRPLADIAGSLPVLIKFIDAARPLSIQVHPTEEYARMNPEAEAKNEMWYIMDCEPDSYIYYGFNRDISREEFERRIKDNTICDVLNKIKVTAGDCVFVKAGTIHAIGEGCLICEIQQNSNTTYRVYDYDRRGADGRPRELHIDKALEVTYTGKTDYDLSHSEDNIRVLADCEYFKSTLYRIDKNITLSFYDKLWMSVIVLSGNARLTYNGMELDINEGDSLYVPASVGEVMVNGNCELITTTA